MDIDFYNILSVIRGKVLGFDEEQIQDLIISTIRLQESYLEE